LAVPEVALPDPFHLLASEDRSVGSGGEVDDPEVHAEPSFGFDGHGFWSVNSYHQNPLAIPMDQVGLSLGPAEKCLVPYFDENIQSSIDRPNGNMVILPRKNSLVIDYGFLVELPLASSIEFIGVADDAYCPDDKLTGETRKCLAAFLVSHLVKSYPIELLGGKCLLGEPIASLPEDFGGLPQGLFLSPIGNQLNGQCLLHTGMILQGRLILLQCLKDFLVAKLTPRINSGVSLES